MCLDEIKAVFAGDGARLVQLTATTLPHQCCEGTGMQHPQPAVHRTIIVVDVEGFGDRRRTNPHKLAVRNGLYRALQLAFDKSGVSWNACRYEDRGDGVFILAPPEIPKVPFVDALPGALAAELRQHNAAHPAAERIRLRMALHAGEIVFDEHGVTATSVNLAFRLLEAKPLKTALAESPGTLALITSGWFFQEVVRHSEVTDPAIFRPVRVAVKETSTVGWISLPDHPYPPDVSVLTAPLPDEPAGPVPHQLPAAPGTFVGRAEELATLTTALDSMAGGGGTVVISAIAGAGGIGKTWLALHWAHQHADRFPDGQLFVDLRGFSPDNQPMDPQVALRGFLDAFGDDPAQIPADPHAQAARYRSLVAGKRILIVLDNAANTDQIFPLLPGGPLCTVVVTSRRALTALITRHGARYLHLNPLTTEDAHALLTDRLGSQRVAAEHDAVADLIGFCCGFALALGLIAGRAHAHPHIPLTQFAAELRDLGLAVLDDDDPTASLPAVLSWSYQALSTELQTVFGLLGIAPGADIALPTAASLTGLPPAQVRQALRALEEASLLDQDAHGRYAMHDLIRAYATSTAHHLADDIREAALGRVIDHYLHVSYVGDRLCHPHRIQIGPAPPTAGSHPYTLFDHTAAQRWFKAEHLNLVATQQVAVERGWHTLVWQLAWALSNFHQRQGYWLDELAVWQKAMAAAERIPDPTTQVEARRLLGYACAQLGRHKEAETHLNDALALAHQTGDLPGEAHAYRTLAWAWHLRGYNRRGHNRRALELATHALRLYRSLDLPIKEAHTLTMAGWYAVNLGEYKQAQTHCQAALELCRRHQDLDGEANTLDDLGVIAHHARRYAQAIDYLQRALTLRRDLDHTFEEARTLEHLGRPYAALGQRKQARTVWQEALELYQQHGRGEEAARVRQLLDELDNRPSDT